MQTVRISAVGLPLTNIPELSVVGLNFKKFESNIYLVFFLAFSGFLVILVCIKQSRSNSAISNQTLEECWSTLQRVSWHLMKQCVEYSSLFPYNVMFFLYYHVVLLSSKIFLFLFLYVTLLLLVLSFLFFCMRINIR